MPPLAIGFGLGLRRRLARLAGKAKGARRRLRRRRPAPGARLNVGCGRFPLAGWINVDLQRLPGVDRVVDVRRGIPYRELAAIYAEHFLEHLTFEEAIGFLRECRRALGPGGTLRLSTPNLVWVWWTHDVRLLPDSERALRAQRAFEANRAFYGWQHRFLWSRELLAEALEACGFERCRFLGHGESPDPALRGLEQHETWPDTPEAPHVLVVEADAGRFEPARLEAFLERARDHFLGHQKG